MKASAVYRGEKTRKRSRKEAWEHASKKPVMFTERSSSFFRNYGNSGNNIAAAMMTMNVPNFGKEKTQLNGGLETGKGSRSTKTVMDVNEEALMVWDKWDEVSDIEIRDVSQQRLFTMETKEEWDDGWSWQQYLDVISNNDNDWTIPEDREVAWEYDLWEFPELPDFKQLPKP